MSTRRRFLLTLPASAALLATAGCAPASPPQAAEEEVLATAMNKAAQEAMTPDQALAELRAGNERFVSGAMRRRDLTAQVQQTATQQSPFAVVLGCIDSRVPPELVFDQGIGDLFSPRVAGNFANTDIIGSIEFATALVGSRLVVVLGHTDCGAVKGACSGATFDPEFDNLTQTLGNLAPALEAVTDVEGERSDQNKAFVQEVTDANVRLTVQALTEQSPVLRDLASDPNRLKIVGAMHDVATGRVTFFT